MLRYAAHVNKLRSILLEAVTEEDMREVVQTLIQKAKSGDMAAIRILFDRALGKAEAVDQMMSDEKRRAEFPVFEFDRPPIDFIG